jgi:hypothetical protein
LGENYTVICTLADFSAIVIYTNRPSGVIAYLVAMLASANMLSGAGAGRYKPCATLVSVNKHIKRHVGTFRVKLAPN